MKYTLPLKILSEANLRCHWAARAARMKRHRQTADVMTPAPRLVSLPATITLTRIAPRALDSDNLAGGFKGVRDGVADKLGINDNDPRVTWVYAQRKGKPREYAAEVEISSQ